MSLTVTDIPTASAWFIESGLVSMVAESAEGREIEVGVIGREGVVDPSAILGADRAMFNCFAQVPGSALRMPAAELRRALEASTTLRALLTRYMLTLMVQIAHTALANATHTIEKRLARWLLMSDDRVDGHEVQMTHDFLAVMLGVRRAGVTEAVQSLVAMGLIEAGRGKIVIRDRVALAAYVRDLYGLPEATYQSLIAEPVPRA